MAKAKLVFCDRRYR